MAVMVNGARIEQSGYEFGVANESGYVVEYPNYVLACEGLEFLRSEGQKKAQLKMRVIYRTGWTDAHEN